jgi:hypothetical protein
MAHFDIPLDLPHAGRIADRILTLLERHVEEQGLDAPALLDTAEALSNRLFRYTDAEENPKGTEAETAREEAAMLGRQLVDLLESSSIRGDRLGQFVRNLFECLAQGEEGAALSLRAGEDPDSLQRPV